MALFPFHFVYRDIHGPNHRRSRSQARARRQSISRPGNLAGQIEERAFARRRRLRILADEVPQPCRRYHSIPRLMVRSAQVRATVRIPVQYRTASAPGAQWTGILRTCSVAPCSDDMTIFKIDQGPCSLSISPRHRMAIGSSQQHRLVSCPYCVDANTYLAISTIAGQPSVAFFSRTPLRGWRAGTLLSHCRWCANLTPFSWYPSCTCRLF